MAATLIPTKILEGVDRYEATPEMENDFRQNDTLIIIGDAPCVWDDLEAWWDLADGLPHDVLCINESALKFPCEFLHFAAGDSHDLDMQEIAASLPDTVIKHAYNPTSKHFDVRWIRRYGGWNGTTAFFAIKIALAMDYLRIVLVGCPLTNTGHFYQHELVGDDPRISRLKNVHENHIWKFVELASRPISSFVRSMSGNTADILGEPDRAWLDEMLIFKAA